MTWFDLVKLHPDEESDFKRFGQPDWDKGIEEIKDNENLMALTDVFTERPHLRTKYHEAKPWQQKIVRLLAQMRLNVAEHDRNRDGQYWTETNTDVTGDRKPIERVDVMDDRFEEDEKTQSEQLLDSIEATLEDQPDYDFKFKDWKKLL